MTTIIAVVFLILFALTLLLVGLGIRVLEAERKKKVTTTLRTISRVEDLPQTSILIDRLASGKEGQIDQISDLPIVHRIEERIQQAGLTWTLKGLLAATVILSVLGVLLGTRVAMPIFREVAMVGLGLLFSSLPYLYVLRKRKKRLWEFEEQFPESLDFMARSMRAGHAFSVSLEMMADESPEPVGTELRHLFHEQNLGAPLEVALKNLAIRMPLLDVRFFVSAVLLQRETGGNLAEILTNLANIIRERFRLKGHVRAVSAHGRLTAIILSIMPVVTALLLMIIAPSYLKLLADDAHGKYLIVASILAMCAGYFWMKRIIDIKV